MAARRVLGAGGWGGDGRGCGLGGEGGWREKPHHLYNVRLFAVATFSRSKYLLNWFVLFSLPNVVEFLSTCILSSFVFFAVKAKFFEQLSHSEMRNL